ncbi:MAG TPA: serine hydrolase [Acidimicrobiales bacterium]|nr:serine hydrolase [Acidimicrobiales bacterium]
MTTTKTMANDNTAGHPPQLPLQHARGAIMFRRRFRRRTVGVFLIGALFVVASCSGSTSEGSSSNETTSTAHRSSSATPALTIPNAKWKPIDASLAGLGPQTGLLVAKVTPEGTCEAIHEVAASTVRPIASQFKLLVLGALAEQIEAGKISWNQELTVPEVRSLGNEGAKDALQAAPAGATFSVEHVATQMISISDNTAADMLVDLVGRDAVSQQFARWTDNAERNTPMLKTREMLLLHYAEGLGDEYLATPQAERDAFLADQVDPLSNADIASGYTTEPRFIDEIEWFATPDDLCRTFAGLQKLATNPKLAPLDGVLSKEDFGLDLDPAEWPTVWYKGGSEAGVLTTGWLATDADGGAYVVEVTIANPDAALAQDAIPTDVKLVNEIFALLGAS